MKKASPKGADELRSEYKRSDFGKTGVRKYAARLATETNVVMLEPDIAKAFPNDAAVNEALRDLLEVAKTTARLIRRSTRTGQTLARR